MYLSSPFDPKRINIGGGLWTPAHTESNRLYGKLSYDLVPEGAGPKAVADMKYYSGGSNWAVYNLLGSDVYAFYVHIKNYNKGTVKRGEVVSGREGSYFTHINMVRGSAGNNLEKGSHHIDWIKYLDPSVHIVTNWGGTDYTGKNKGEHLPSTLPINNNEMVNLSVDIQTVAAPEGVSLRPVSNRSKAPLLVIPPSTVLRVSAVEKGEVINNNDTWYYTTYNNQKGYVHATVANILVTQDEEKIKGLTDQLNISNQKLKESESKILSLTGEVNNFTTKLDSLTKIADEATSSSEANQFRVETLTKEIQDLKTKYAEVEKWGAMLGPYINKLRELWNSLISKFKE